MDWMKKKLGAAADREGAHAKKLDSPHSLANEMRQRNDHERRRQERRAKNAAARSVRSPLGSPTAFKFAATSE